MLVVGNTYTTRNGASVTITEFDPDETSGGLHWYGTNNYWYYANGRIFEDVENDADIIALKEDTLSIRISRLESQVIDLEKVIVDLKLELEKLNHN